jgi:hypothetical protein
LLHTHRFVRLSCGAGLDAIRKLTSDITRGVTVSIREVHAPRLCTQRAENRGNVGRIEKPSRGECFLTGDI